MDGLLDEDPAGVRIATLTNAAAALFIATGVFSGDEAKEGHELFGVLEATEGSNFTDGNHGGDELEAFEGHESVDEWFALPVAQELEHRFFEAGDAFVVEVDGGEVVFEDAIVCGIGKFEITEVAQVGFGPVGLSLVVVTKSAKHGEEACLSATKVINGIGSGPTKVADGLVDAVRNVDGNEVIGAKIFGEFHGVAFVSFDAVTGFDGDQRGCNDFAPDAHLEEAPGDPKTTSARFVTDVKVREFTILAFSNATDGPFESVLGGGDGTVVPRFGIAITFEDRNDGFCFMDVESEVECLWCA